MTINLETLLLDGDLLTRAGANLAGISRDALAADPAFANRYEPLGGAGASITLPLVVAEGGTGATTEAGARTALGLGSLAQQAADNVAITGGSIIGITPLALAEGGTNATTAVGARTQLGLGTASTRAVYTDGTFVTAQDDLTLPTSLAVKTWVDARIAALPGGGGGGNVSTSDTDVTPGGTPWGFVYDTNTLLPADAHNVLPTVYAVKGYIDTRATLVSSDPTKLSVSTGGSPPVTTLDVSALLSTGTSNFVDTAFRLDDSVDSSKQLKISASNVPTGITRTYSVPSQTGSTAMFVTEVAAQTLSNKKMAGYTSLLAASFMGLDFGFPDGIQVNGPTIFGGPAAIPGIGTVYNGALSTTKTATPTGAEIFRIAARAVVSNATIATTDMARLSAVTVEAPTTGARGTTWRFATTRIGSTTLENVFAVNAGADVSTGGTVTVRNQMLVGGGDVAALPAAGVGIDLVGGAFRMRDPAATGGYGTGAGSTVTQATSKSTAVTINTPSGQITTHNAALANATHVVFTVNNSSVGANDTVIVHRISGGTGSSYWIFVDAVAAGSFNIMIRNQSGGSLSEAIVLQYAVIRGATA